MLISTGHVDNIWLRELQTHAMFIFYVVLFWLLQCLMLSDVSNRGEKLKLIDVYETWAFFFW